MPSCDRIFTFLTKLAQANEPCPRGVELAAVLKISKVSVTRGLQTLENVGSLRRSRGKITLLIGPAAGESIRRTRSSVRARPLRPAPPCVICGDPVPPRSNKYARSCAKPSCRTAIRSWLNGRPPDDSDEWPVVTGEVVADFTPHELRFAPMIIGRLPESSPPRSYGVSPVYDGQRSE